MTTLTQELLDQTRDERLEALVEDKIAALVAPLREVRTELEAERVGLRENLSDIDRQIQRIDRMLKAAEAPAKQRARRSSTMPAEKVTMVAEALRTFDEPVSGKRLYQYLREHGHSIGEDAVRKALDNLHVRGEVRRAGTVQGGGNLWAVKETEPA